MNLNEMNKPALVDLAVARGVVKNKTAARRTEKAELIRLLAPPPAPIHDDTPGPVVPGTASTLDMMQQPIRTTIPAPSAEAERADDITDSVRKAEATDHIASVDGRPVAPVRRRIVTEPAREPAPRTPVPLHFDSPTPKRLPHGASNSSEVQRARQAKLARNRRKHKRALARRRHGWANGQGHALA